jgi:hypothetical protein
MYFWEQGPARALQFAANEATRNSSKIQDPSVIGAYIFLGNCFDLLDVKHTQTLADVYGEFKKAFRERGLPLPINRKKRADGTKLFHERDRAVIEYAIAFLERDGEPEIDTVRCAFEEGHCAFPGAEIRQQTHIQIAVRNPDCVLVYFKPKAI